MTRVVSVKNLRNNAALSHVCCEEKEVSKKKSCSGVMIDNEIYEKNLFLSDVYAGLEEARQNLLDGRCSSIENAVSRIRQKHGL